MTVTYREGRIEDLHSVFQVFERAIVDYSTCMGVMAITGGNEPEVLESLWQKISPYLSSSRIQRRNSG